jgi:hypothetical protein
VKPWPHSIRCDSDVRAQIQIGGKFSLGYGNFKRPSTVTVGTACARASATFILVAPSLATIQQAMENLERGHQVGALLQVAGER